MRLSPKKVKLLTPLQKLSTPDGMELPTDLVAYYLH